MKKAASIFLRSDITLQDLNAMISWMENPNVTRYLNEDSHVIAHLSSLADPASGPLLTYYFNQHGRFFLVCPAAGPAIGFVSLRSVDVPGCYEIVYAIGEESLWGQGLGESTLRAALSMVFLEWRGSRVLARIYPENARSLRSVRSCGFRCTADQGKLHRYEISAEEYLRSLRQHAENAIPCP